MTREVTGATHIIALMSGNFVQRGEPALIDKVARTRMALKCGVDMVLELPVEYATGSADIFATGAVNILNATNIVDSLCFGSEAGDISAFSDIADVLNNEPEEFKILLKASLETGANYPTARALALAHYLNRDISFLNNPNNILALEYVRALKRTSSSIWPYTVTRTGSSYGSEEINGENASAAAVRAAIFSGNFEAAYNAMPEECVNILSDYSGNPHSIDDFSDALHYILRMTPKELLSSFADVTEGLENRIINNLGTHTITELINILKTKRYTYTKLQRALLHIILGITKKEQQKMPRYIRVLGFRKSAESLLTELTQRSDLPVITNAKSSPELLKRDIRCTDLYYMSESGELGREFTNPIVVEG
jgi:predicted nucleotidyltransferase